MTISVFERLGPRPRSRHFQGNYGRRRKSASRHVHDHLGAGGVRNASMKKRLSVFERHGPQGSIAAASMKKPSVFERLGPNGSVAAAASVKKPRVFERLGPQVPAVKNNGLDEPNTLKLEYEEITPETQVTPIELGNRA